MDPLKIIFMGTPEFAVASLNALMQSPHEIVCVVTASDKKGGRGMKKTIQSAVKKAAVSMNLPVLQPTNLKDNTFIHALSDYQADLFVVVAFRMLPKAVWSLPRLGTINLHGSLLPKYRGAAPIHWAIIRGERETGLTTFKIQEKIDTGDLIDQAIVPINQKDTAGTLHDKMMEIGAILLQKTVQSIAENKVHFEVQQDSLATSAPKLYHSNTHIDFNQSSENVYNFIRGLSPWPTAWMTLDGVETKVLEAQIAPEHHPPLRPGQIQTDNKSYLLIGTTDKPIKILKLKMSGKRAMDIRPFLNGYQIKGESVE